MSCVGVVLIQEFWKISQAYDVKSVIFSVSFFQKNYICLKITKLTICQNKASSQEHQIRERFVHRSDINVYNQKQGQTIRQIRNTNKQTERC